MLTMFSRSIFFLPAVFVAFFTNIAIAEEEIVAPDGFDLYGQINRGYLYYDDGGKSYSLPFVGGSKSEGRFGLTYSKTLSDGWQGLVRGELGITWKETDRVSQRDLNDSAYTFDKEALRKFELVLSHAKHGVISFGQGSMSGSDAASQDLSLTNVVSGASVRGIAGGMYIRENDGTLSNIRIRDRFKTLGFSRTFRLRYDTPINNGVTFGVAAGKEVLNDRDGRYYADATIKYNGSRGDYRLLGAASIRWAGGNPDTEFREESLIFLTSGSILHIPSRYNLTGSFGYERNEGYYGYLKFGRRWYKFLPYGWTAASIDYYYTEGSGTYEYQGDSIGLSIVQDFKEQNFSIYGTVRSYSYEEPTKDFFDSMAFLTGLRWEF